MRVSGFTLVELLVTAVIIITLTGFGLASWGRFRRKTLVESAAAELQSELRLTRSWALNGRKLIAGCSVLDGYRVGVNNGNLEIFICCQGNCNQLVKTIEINGDLTKNFSGFPIKFLSLTGLAEITGSDSAEITLTQGEFSQTIIIDSSGEIQ